MLRYRPLEGQRVPRLRDVSAFAQALLSGDPRVCGPFEAGRGPVTVVRVPARLDVMGGIADYAGATVCEGTLRPAVVLGLRARKDEQIHVHSLGLGREGWPERFSLPTGAFYQGTRIAGYGRVGRSLRREAAGRWAAYVVGGFHVLLRERIVDRLPCGFSIVLRSDVPMGAGVASSAAVEVATLFAATRVLAPEVGGVALARLGQIVENRVVGAPCGIMDQLVTLLGGQGSLLAIRCQPAEVLGRVRLPPGCAVGGVYSGVKHAVGGSRYTDVRVGAFMGLTILQAQKCVGAEANALGGYLANLTPEAYVRRCRRVLPARMRGEAFLRRYGETPDPVTRVDPERTYGVRSRAEHPIYENERGKRFIRCLEQARTTGEAEHLERAGRLMYASHWSYRSRCGLDAPETALLVRLARSIGVRGGVYGARVTGGGSGGTVAVLGRRDRLAANLRRMALAYEERTGICPVVFRGSSPGAEAFGHLTYVPEDHPA